MTKLMIIALFLLAIAWLGRKLFASLRPAAGYEDELGFHYDNGSAKQPLPGSR